MIFTHNLQVSDSYLSKFGCGYTGVCGTTALQIPLLISWYYVSTIEKARAGSIANDLLVM